MEIVKKNIRTTPSEEIASFLESHGEKSFRVKQITEWLWKKSAHSFDEMTNLSLPLRSLLSEHFELLPVTIAEQQKSTDGTVKNAFRLYDEKIVEGVLIPTTSRMTACISSQAGCSLTCA